MPASKAQQKAVSKYMKENYDVYQIRMKPKGRLETVKAHAAARGESANAFIGRAIQEAIERDTHSGPQEAVGEPKSENITTVQPIPRGTLKIVGSAAKAAGESPGDFIFRAVTTQAKRDDVERELKGGEQRGH